MNTQQQKLDAALDVVADSVLHGWTIESKIKYIKNILPGTYEVKESKQAGNVHCKSAIGFIIEDEDDEQWNYFMSCLRSRFEGEFLEVFHNTYHNHVDFTIYFKKQN